MSGLTRCAKEGCETQVDGVYCIAHRICASYGCIDHVYVSGGKYCERHLPRMGGSERVVRMPPVAGGDPVVERVVASFQARSEAGRLKYGTTLARTDLTTTTFQWLQHLQEELMDAVLYIERLKDEDSCLHE